NEGIDANSNGVIDLDSMSTPATAKDCITVGAIENYRLSGGAQSTYGAYWPTDYPANPINSDKVSNNSSGMAAFSSRGPCDDGRIKPDICAPGTNIISARSHVAGAGTLWGVYDTNYVYSGGTSMSTPLTAGSCALLREYYRTQKSYSTPTSALIKGTLINGARDIYPGQYGTGDYLETPVRPNSVEGWGAVDLASILILSGLREFRYDDYTTGLSTGGSRVYNYTLNGTAHPFRVTLVWTDYPGALYASPALVNDLDLTVTTPTGGTLYGNGTTDRTNNVEGVDINSPATGAYTVTVNAYNVPSGPQPFALVVSGDLGTPPTATISSPAAGTTLFGSVTLKGTATSPYFTNYTLEYGAGSSPTTWIAIGSPHTTQVTNNVLGTWDTSLLANGTYTVRLTVNDSRGLTATAQRTFTVLKTSVSGVKGSVDGTSVTLTGKIVTASTGQFSQTMYMQETDRSSGIKVNLGATPTTAVIGSLVTVTGTIQKVNGIRQINNPTVTVTGSGTADPVAMINRNVGGSDFNAYTPGVTGGVGLNNISLLIRTWGRVTYVGADYLYFDDGSALEDGSGHTGIKVSCPGLTLPGSTQYAIVTGICSVEINGSTARRLILPRMQDDLVYY
ncbi:MAG TPA: S8 family serine peptidase, partial [Armatimonadota bacterium]|nr:S8 family serine peptidase [Armatimonadota bacterium]